MTHDACVEECDNKKNNTVTEKIEQSRRVHVLLLTFRR